MAEMKLNTEAWEENAKAKMQNNIAILQSELEALEEETRNSETRRSNLIRL